MRLVDADAVKAALNEWKDTDRPWKARTDYATAVWDCIVLLGHSPTVACERCEHYKDNHTAIPTGWCKWHDAGMYPDDGCVRYMEATE